MARSAKGKSFQQRLNRFFERPLATSFTVLGILTLVVLGTSATYYINDFENFWPQILAEAHGMLFDIAVIGILIYWLNQNREQRQRIHTYKDEIEDFRLWESEEAAYRTVGNIKRLNRHRIYNIDLTYCFLARTNLSHVVLNGANLNYANLTSTKAISAQLQDARLNQTLLENADLNQAHMVGAYAGGARFKDAILMKANLEKSFLIKADFTNAILIDANLRGAHLAGAELENANLYKADLRGAVGLTVEQLSRVKTLYLAQFDPDIMEQLNQALPELIAG